MDAMTKLRWFRNGRLSMSDWTQLSDNKLTQEQKDAWIVYRQALRDLPDNTQDINNPVWPEEPE